MSKSESILASRIDLTDSDDTIASKIKKATMDSIMGITYDSQERPGVANLLNILASVVSKDPQELAKEYNSLSNAEFKKIVSDAVISLVRPIREEISRLEKDNEYLDSVLKLGEMKAHEKAEATMVKVRNVIGLS